VFKRVIGIGLLLAFITGFSGFAIAAVNNLTGVIIEKQMLEAKYSSLQEVYPGEGEIKDESSTYLANHPASALKEVYVVYRDGSPAGVVYTVETQGYNGLIRTLVAFDSTSQTISGVKVLKQSETPGLGTNSAEKWFGERFLAKGIAAQLEVTKLAPNKDNEIQAITAATITTTAVVDGVNIARLHFLENFVNGR